MKARGQDICSQRGLRSCLEGWWGGQYTCGFGEGVHALMHPSQGKVAAGHKTHSSRLEILVLF